MLCTARLGRKSLIINNINEKNLNIMFTKKEHEVLFRKMDDEWTAKESVIGGSCVQGSPARNNTVIVVGASR